VEHLRATEARPVAKPTARAAAGPATTAAAVLALQSRLGNRATRALVARQSVGGTCSAQPQMGEARRTELLQTLCFDEEAIRTSPPVVDFSARERRIVVATLWEARSKAGQAASNLARGDPWLHRLAERFFHETTPSLEQLAGTALRIHDALVSTPYERGTCGNELCTTEGPDGRRQGSAIMADADVDRVRHSSDVITICPYFFDSGHSPSELVRTWLHEAGHICHIDDPPAGQRYVHPTNCPEQRGDNPTCPPAGHIDDPCPRGDVNNVDNWAHFIERAAAA
jgi:hypothetical protein